MIKLIVGNKGSGKTKTLINMINEATTDAKGDIVCVEKSMKLTYDIKHTVRLIDIDEYDVSGYDAFYGFMAGLMAGNYDITEIFVDGILKIGGRNLEELGNILDKVEVLAKKADMTIVFTVSCDMADLTDNVRKYL